MPKIVQCGIKPFLQPFERRLALFELESLAKAPAKHLRQIKGRDVYEVRTSVSTCKFLRRLSYWETVENSEVKLTDQVLHEATTTVARNGVSRSDMATWLPF